MLRSYKWEDKDPITYNSIEKQWRLIMNKFFTILIATLLLGITTTVLAEDVTTTEATPSKTEMATKRTEMKAKRAEKKAEMQAKREAKKAEMQAKREAKKAEIQEKMTAKKAEIKAKMEEAKAMKQSNKTE